MKKEKKPDCCPTNQRNHPDHTKYLPRIKKIQGQITGIEKMIDDRRYCVDILIQFKAVMAALRSIEVSVFETHLEHCVQEAMNSKDESQTNQKIKEITQLLSRRNTL